MPQIDAIHLKKCFGSLAAVDDVSLQVDAGQIFGLVGSDGAGKTTTLRLLVGALRPDSGKISICNIDVSKHPEDARSQVGYLSQRFSLYDDLTVLENIRFFAEVRGLESKTWLPRCLEILNFVGLVDFKDRRAGQLSGGMKQKLGLASALVSQPKVLLLDEPTTGVDPITRQDFWQLIIRISIENSLAVILTTPYMDEASRCSRLGFLRSGKIVAEGTPTQLRNSLGTKIIEIHCASPLTQKTKLIEIDGVIDVRAFGEKLHITSDPEKVPSIIAELEKTVPEDIRKFGKPRMMQPSLEDVFLSLSSEK